jgi:ABC-2 type transport system permease protein
MSDSLNAMPEVPDSRETAPAAMQAPRPLYWSVRRELWENRSIYLAPLTVAAVFLFGFLISMIRLPHKMRGLAALDAAKQRAAVAMPYSAIAGVLVATAFVVGMFYCLDALHGERRDRSILFWKSLPVSDRTTVLAKALIPLVILPLIVFAIIVTVQTIMLWLSTAVLLGSGTGAATLWSRLPLFRMSLVLLYALAAISLWQAPLYGWLLLVSGWARRAAILWAVLPPLAICIFEMIAFRTSYFAKLLGYRVVGWFPQAFAFRKGLVPADPLSQLTPGDFLSTPGLWIGLIFATAFLAAAARLRRDREPI